MKRATSLAVRTATAFAVAAAVLVPATAAVAATATTFPSNTYYFDNLWGGRCLDGGAATLGTPAQLWACNGTLDQQWTVVHPRSSDPAFQIRSRQSGGCLGIYQGSTGNGASVRMLPCTTNYEDLWTGGMLSGGSWMMVNAASGKQLEAYASSGSYNGSKVDIWSDTGRSNQVWSAGNRW
jgi:hypothetical protein